MKLRNMLLATATMSSLAFGSLFIAAPAHAATDFPVAITCPSGVMTFGGGSSINVSANDTITLTNNTGRTLDSQGVIQGANVTSLSNFSNGSSVVLTISASGSVFLGDYGANPTCGGATFSWTVGVAPTPTPPIPGPPNPTNAAVSQPAEVSLSLDLAASGASCKEGSAATGVMGAWLFLPAADDCSSTTDPSAKLLGWSTSANFPVDRAQSQVDNRWGAIDEIFDGVRMIFIPAGQATFVSGPNSLFPIWAS